MNICERAPLKLSDLNRVVLKVTALASRRRPARRRRGSSARPSGSAWRLSALAATAIGLGGCAASSADRASGEGGTDWPQPPDAAAVEHAAALNSQAAGRPAPDFTLKNHAGRDVSLEDFRGRWLVLYFYPRDDTPGCTCQATEFTDLLASFRDMNAAVVGVSNDAPVIHRRFREKYDLALTLLSDRRFEVAQRYGASATIGVGDGKRLRMLRQTFLINPQGRIAWHWPEVIPQGHADRVRRRLEQLQGPDADR